MLPTDVIELPRSYAQLKELGKAACSDGLAITPVMPAISPIPLSAMTEDTIGVWPLASEFPLASGLLLVLFWIEANLEDSMKLRLPKTLS